MFGPAVSHVTIGTRDLDATVALLRGLGLAEERYPGGACFPVGSLQYIEVQHADSDGRPLQQWLHSIVGGSQRWCGWAIAVPDLGFAHQVDLAVAAVDQRGAGAGFAPWQFEVAGGDRMRASRGVAPYFIRYGHDAARHAELLRRRVGGRLPEGAAGFTEVRIGDPAGLLDSWLAPVGGPPAGVVVDREVEAGVVGVAVRLGDEVVRIDIADT